MDIGLNVKTLRKERMLTQKELADSIHIAQNTLSQIENDVAKPSIDVLVLLADVFECSVDYLLGRADDFGVISIKDEKKASPALSAEEARLLETYRALNTKNRIHVSTYADIRLEQQAEEKTPSSDFVSTRFKRGV